MRSIPSETTLSRIEKLMPRHSHIFRRLHSSSTIDEEWLRNFGYQNDINIIITNWDLPKLIRMYTYFRDHQPIETENFEWLNSILTNPSLDELWGKILRQEHHAKAFLNAPAYKNHRLDNQPEDTRDLRHPFFVLAGGYYYYRSTKKSPVFSAGNNAMNHINKNEFNEALEAFETQFSDFKPHNKTQKNYQKIILKKIEYLKNLGNLNDPDNYESVAEAFEIIHEQISELRKTYEAELDSGMKYECIRCYTAAQALDLDTVNAYIGAKVDLLKPSTTKLLYRIEARAEKVEQDHYTIGALLAGKSYLQIAKAMRAAMQLIRKTISDYRLFTIPKPCGFSTEEPLQKELQLQKNLAKYEHGQTIYFKKALKSFKKAERLEAEGNDTALIHNATDGKNLPDTTYLKYNDTMHESISALRTHIECEIEGLCPMAITNTGTGCENDSDTNASVVAVGSL